MRWWGETANPFPRAAIARPSALSPGTPTIPTPAVEDLRRLIDEYVAGTLSAESGARSGQAPQDDGQILVIEGDYGSGKTHLIREALSRVAEARKTGFDPRPVYLTAPGGSLVLLYTEVMRDIGLHEMLARVLEFYSDVVANDLRGHPFAKQQVGQLERDEVDPRLVIADHGLSEGALLAELRRRLSSVTSDQAFSHALVLLLQSELRDMVWEWLLGGSPSQLLRENGLSRPIDTDIQALEALGVLARIYRRGQRRFVLAVDEMEKLVLSWNRSDQGRVQAFKKLLEVFRRTGALLIIAGLPEIFEILPPETQRIDAIIRPSDLGRDNVQWYIAKTMATARRRETLEPFTPESIDYIVYATRGRARDVVRLCYYAYESASATGREITRDDVNRVATTLSRQGGAREMVRGEIRQLLAEQARTPVEGWLFPGIPEVVVDFWVPVGDQGAGCAVFISDSILDDHQAAIVADRISLVRSSGSGRTVIQVVSGYLPADLRRRLEEALSGEPLIAYSPGTFDAEFTRVMNAAVGLIVGEAVESSPGGAELRMLREETSRLASQQATMLRLIQESASRDEQLLGTLQRAVTAGPGAPRLVPEDKEASLPPGLKRLFGAAEDSLTAYGDVRALVDDAFALAEEEPGVTYALAYRLRDSDAFAPIGVMTFLAALLQGFQRGVQAWLGSLGQPGERVEALTTGQVERLRAVCQAYNALYDTAPLFKLDRLPEITSATAAGQGNLSRAGRTMRADALRGAFDGLGDRVYQAAVELAGTDGGS
jgi:type II secretory pathway predicted ATPase ExeA